MSHPKPVLKKVRHGIAKHLFAFGFERQTSVASDDPAVYLKEEKDRQYRVNLWRNGKWRVSTSIPYYHPASDSLMWTAYGLSILFKDCDSFDAAIKNLESMHDDIAKNAQYHLVRAHVRFAGQVYPEHEMFRGPITYLEARLRQQERITIREKTLDGWIRLISASGMPYYIKPIK